MKLDRHLVLGGLLTALLFVPVLMLLATGPAPPYGQRPATDFPGFVKFWKSDKARQQLATAAVERLVARKHAIAFRNALLYRAGLIDDDRIVSGRDGWLFYKPQFDLYACGKDALFDDKVERMLMTAAIARLSGRDFTFAIAPNKATILPGQMSARTLLYARCYRQRRDRFAQLLAASGETAIIDHTRALEGYAGDKRSLYFATDTHWTEFGGSFALRDLVVRARAGSGDDGSLYDPKPIAGKLVNPDLRHGMLLIHEQERDVVADRLDEYLARYGAIPGRTVVIHDSFYARIGPSLAKLYADVKLLHVTRDAAKVADTLPGAERIVVSGVERSMLNRFYNGPHDWTSALGLDVLKGNRAAAGQCVYGPDLARQANASPPVLTVRNATSTGDGAFKATTSDPMLLIALPELESRSPQVCLSATLHVPKAGKLAVYPERRRGSPREAIYSNGWSVEIALEAGRNDIALIVPNQPGAATLRLDPVSSVSDFRLEALAIGHLRR